MALVEALAAPPLVIKVTLPAVLASVGLPFRVGVRRGGGGVWNGQGPPGDPPPARLAEASVNALEPPSLQAHLG